MTVRELCNATNYNLRISVHDIKDVGLYRARLSEPVIQTKYHGDLKPWMNYSVVLVEPYDHCLSVFINSDE